MLESQILVSDDPHPLHSMGTLPDFVRSIAAEAENEYAKAAVCHFPFFVSLNE
jgi:hypothetical protein